MTSTDKHNFRHTLLLVSDDTLLAEEVSEVFTDTGARLHSAKDFEQALLAIKQSTYDLVLLSTDKGQKPLLHQLSSLKSGDPSTPIAVISRDHSISMVANCYQKGASAFIRAPVIKEEILHCLSSLILQGQLEKQVQSSHKKLNSADKMHQFVVENSPDLIYILDENHHFTFVNPQVEKLLNISREEIIGSHFSLLMSDEEQRRQPYVFNERRATPRNSTRNQIHLRKRLSLSEGKASTTLSIPFEIHAIGIYDLDRASGVNLYRGTYGIASDITDRKQAESLMRFQAYHDLLTGLPNRSLFRDRLSLSISHAKRNHSKVAVMFLDIDRFKVINDSMGHHLGDQLIQAIARRISSSLREGDTLSRFGGDEFTLLAPNIKSKEDAEIIARKVNNELLSPFYIDDHQMHITGSVGIALFPDHGTHVDQLIQNADIAMYQTKAAGKNSFQFFNDQINSSYQNRLNLEQDLHSCIANHELYLVYQPIYDTRTDDVYALEVFLRWDHPIKGLIYPREFIHIAEESGAIIELGAWVINQACAELANWENPYLRIAINLSPLQVENTGFESLLMSAVKTHNISPQQIELEITEQLLMHNHSSVLNKLKRLKRLGFTISVDDFGTGFSALSSLHELPISTLKLDQSFIKQIDNDRKSGEACIINAISAMASGLNLHLVAEGVETNSQKEYLSQLGCHLMQGNLLQDAVTSREARNFIVHPVLADNL